LKAIDELEKENQYEDKLSDNMIMFIAINTASLQIIPTNVIAIRNSLNSENPSAIIVAVWFSSIMTFISIIFLTKTYLKMRRNV
jgi:spore maturation protein A